MPDERLDRIIESLSEVNVHLEGVRIAMQTLNETTADHELRLRTIERWKYNLTPMLAVMTFILGAVFSVALERYL